MIAYHYPPVGGLGAPGSQRIDKFVKHLPNFGWKPTVLTVKESSYEPYLTIDPTSRASGAEDVSVIRTRVIRGLQFMLDGKRKIGSMLSGRQRKEASTINAGDSRSNSSRFQRAKNAFTDLFEIPDETVGWFFPAVLAGRRAIRKNGVDLIFATGRPWTTLVIGATLKTLTGKKLVVDFRDPWMRNPFRLKYSPLKNSAERFLEQWVLAKADLIVTNTEAVCDEFRTYGGDEIAEKCTTVRNGFDRDEFASIQPFPRDEMTRNAYLMTHTGFLYGHRDPKTILLAIQQLRDQGKIRQGEFVCQLVGNIELSYDLDEYIAETGLEQFVRVTGQVPLAESLARLAGSDAALLIQPGTLTQVPSKLYEYIGLRMNILAVAPAKSSVESIIRDNDLGIVVDSTCVESIAAALNDLLADWRKGSSENTLRDSKRSKFDVVHSSSKLSDEMSKLLA